MATRPITTFRVRAGAWTIFTQRAFDRVVGTPVRLYGRCVSLDPDLGFDIGWRRGGR